MERGGGWTEAAVGGEAGEEMGLHSYARVPWAWLEESQQLASREGVGGDPLKRGGAGRRGEASVSE